MIEDDVFRVESKVNEFMIPEDETRIEFTKWKNLPEGYLTKIQKLQPDLLAFHSVLVPDDWIVVVLQMKKNFRFRKIPIFLSSYFGSITPIQQWMQCGVTDVISTSKPEEIVNLYLAYLDNPREYIPRYVSSGMYFGARREGMH